MLTQMAPISRTERKCGPILSALDVGQHRRVKDNQGRVPRGLCGELNGLRQDDAAALHQPARRLRAWHDHGRWGADRLSRSRQRARPHTPNCSYAGRNRCLSRAELEVRIHSPPADSPCLAGYFPPTSKSRAFAAGVRGGAGSAVGRDGRGAVIWRRPAAISLSGQIPVPQRR